MNLDQRTLNLAAAGLSLVAAVLAVVGGRRDSIARLSGVLGFVGTAAWALSAVQEYQQSSTEPEYV